MDRPGPDARLDELISEVRELQRRVADIERRMLRHPAPALPAVEPADAADEPSAERGLEQTASALPILGRGLLALAGAYLLRALTEYGTIPRPAGVAAGIAYAAMWLVMAARAPMGARLVVAIHGLTAALVLGPLLFETTVQLKVVEPATAAGLLALFSMFGLAVSWQKNLAGVAWITTLAGLGTSLVLMVATHDVVPFTLGVLAIAAAVEVSAFGDHWLGERWIVAGAANLCALLLTWLVTREGGPPASYAPISTEVALSSLAALLVVYVGGTVARTLVRGLRITVFETAQTVLAFTISLSGALQVAAGRPAAEAVVGGLAMVGGAACYLVSFLLLERKAAAARNLYTYSTFALLLATAGSWLLLARSPLTLWWSALALVSVWIGIRSGRSTLRLHGAFYLAAASISGGGAAEAASRLLGSPPAADPPGFDMMVVAAASTLATLLLLRGPTGDSRGARWLPLMAIAALLGWTAAAHVSWALLSVWTWVGSAAGAAGFAATLSTIVLSGLSAALAWTGRRCRCPELVWLMVPFLVLTGYKLLTQDLRQAQTLALFVSLLSYGAVLILLPRLLQQPGKKTPAGN